MNLLRKVDLNPQLKVILKGENLYFMIPNKKNDRFKKPTYEAVASVNKKADYNIETNNIKRLKENIQDFKESKLLSTSLRIL